MNVFDYCLELTLTYFPNQKGRWIARFEGTETKDAADSGVLCGTFGDAQGANESVIDYISKIRGRILVVDAMNKERRREYLVPSDLEW